MFGRRKNNDMVPVSSGEVMRRNRNLPVNPEEYSSELQQPLHEMAPAQQLDAMARVIEYELSQIENLVMGVSATARREYEAKISLGESLDPNGASSPQRLLDLEMRFALFKDRLAEASNQLTMQESNFASKQAELEDMRARYEGMESDISGLAASIATFKSRVATAEPTPKSWSLDQPSSDTEDYIPQLLEYAKECREKMVRLIEIEYPDLARAIKIESKKLDETEKALREFKQGISNGVVSDFRDLLALEQQVIAHCAVTNDILARTALANSLLFKENGNLQRAIASAEAEAVAVQRMTVVESRPEIESSTVQYVSPLDSFVENESGNEVVDRRGV